MNLTDPLEKLLAEQACRQVVLAAARAVDERDWAGLVNLFADDGTLVRPDGTLLQGREAIQAAYAARDPQRITRHLVCNHEIEVGSDGTARSWCAVLLWTGRESDTLTPKGRPADALQQVGHIDDRLRLTAEGWRITARRAAFTLYRD